MLVSLILTTPSAPYSGQRASPRVSLRCPFILNTDLSHFRLRRRMPTPGVLDPNRSQTEVQLYKEEPAREVIHQSTISLAFSSPLPNKLTFSLIYLIYPHYYEMQVAAAKGTAPFPSACDGCAAQFDVTDPGAGAQAAGVAIN
ncbi:hypothetical protein B0H14DRAFT_3126310 [Mycena olivaceomarginata]|nr:hypothetical protein B0H14DRAFT_3126310 [Mycena olivaceomarginata]